VPASRDVTVASRRGEGSTFTITLPDRPVIDASETCCSAAFGCGRVTQQDRLNSPQQHKNGGIVCLSFVIALDLMAPGS